MLKRMFLLYFLLFIPVLLYAQIDMNELIEQIGMERLEYGYPIMGSHLICYVDYKILYKDDQDPDNETARFKVPCVVPPIYGVPQPALDSLMKTATIKACNAIRRGIWWDFQEKRKDIEMDTNVRMVAIIKTTYSTDSDEHELFVKYFVSVNADSEPIGSVDDPMPSDFSIIPNL